MLVSGDQCGTICIWDLRVSKCCTKPVNVIHTTSENASVMATLFHGEQKLATVGSRDR